MQKLLPEKNLLKNGKQNIKLLDTLREYCEIPLPVLPHDTGHLFLDFS